MGVRSLINYGRKKIKMCDNKKDGLQLIFEMQEQLNDFVFVKNNEKNKFGCQLEMSYLKTLTVCRDIGLKANGDLNKWLVNFTKALKEETKELEDEELWKWWSNDKLDIQNIRVEIIDILHFLISLCICSGMGAEDVLRIYKQKHALNIERQNQGYSKETKNESDNKDIK
jgi:hypothetical protein